MKITISCDDGCESDYKVAKLLNKYNLKGVFYLPIDIQGLSISKGWSALSAAHEAYIARNFEIGSHGVTHRYLTRIPLNEAKWEVKDSKSMLENKYDIKITKFAYPRGYTTPEITGYVKEAGYEYARSTAIGFIGKPENPLYAPTAVHMGCPVREEYIGTTWFDYGIKLFEQAKTEKQDFEAWCHGWELDRYNEWANFERFLKVLSNG